MISKEITYFGQKCTFSCDGKCNKAWGINNRPKIQLSDDDDDVVYLADGELPDAPEDPGTYEGGHAKPTQDEQKPNKWCVRECERGGLDRYPPKDYSKRIYNKPSLRPAEGNSTSKVTNEN